jgi:hypothetical protein
MLARTGFAACAAFSLVSTLSAEELFNDNVPSVMDGGGSEGSPSVYTINDGASRSLSQIRVGDGNGYNRFVISHGAASGTTSYIGYSASSGYNSVLVSGSTASWSSSNQIHVGFNGSNNSLVISSGATVASVGANIGRHAGADGNSATVDGAGTMWTITNHLYVGNLGSNNSLTISGGARLTTEVQTYVGFGVSEAPASIDGQNNSVLVTGAGSVWTSVGALNIGNRQTSTSGNVVTVADSALLKQESASFQITNTTSYLRIDGGYFAIKGDQTTLLTSLITGGKIQISDGAGGWFSATDLSSFSLTYVADLDADTRGLTGGLYADLGGYTILSLPASSIPEPASAGVLVGALALGFAGLKRRVRRA